jgi:hypothetical protein
VTRYAVYAADDLVLTMRDEPGPITSTAPPPPGGTPVLHPFLSAAARDATYEDQLADLLADSSDFGEFVERLREAGFIVERER